MSTIESQDLKIADVFRDFYAVPNYQREYIWEQEQVDQLLRDIRTEQLNSADTEYFIGSIVVCRGQNNRFDLIDGQQRLTTLFVITLCALRDRLEALGDRSAVVRRLIAEETVNAAGIDEYQARLDPQYLDAGDAFKKLVDGVPPNIDAPTRSMRNLAGAYQSALAFLVDEFGTDTAELRSFYGYLVNKVKLIRITTDSIARALKIFETINDRGISLDAMDLLKNLLFMKASPAQFDQLRDKWKALTDKLYRAKEKPLRFLRYYLTATHGLVKLQEDELYDWLVKNEQLVGYATNPVGFVDLLADALDAYINFIIGRDASGREHPRVNALTLLAGKSTRQHLVILLSARKLSDDIFSEVCRDAEDLIFVYLVTRVPSREFETYFPNWARQIAVVKTIDEYRAFSMRAFKTRRAELAARFQREFPLINGQDLKQFQLRYLLAKLTQHIDLAAYGKNSAGHLWLSRYCDSGANQIEHILPQTLTDAVRLEFGQLADDPAMVWSVGNLALAESAINQSLGNRPFSEKCGVYPRSQFLLTRAISQRPNIGHTSIDRAVASLKLFTVWNAAAVKERALMLTKIAQEVWDIVPANDTGECQAPKADEPEAEPISAPITISDQEAPKIQVTQIMRHYVATKETDHFGFSGFRAAMACMYARPEGATQAEITQASEILGSPDQKYLNMLREIAPKWRHKLVVWSDPSRGGKVYKLIYNPNHSAPKAVDPPPDWKEMNVPNPPPGVNALEWRSSGE